MVSLQTISSTGRTCPVCGNGSVFFEDIYNCFGLFYCYTIEKCEMGLNICNYQSKIGEDKSTRIVLVEKTKNEG